MRRDVVRHLLGAYGIGERRACSATGFRRSLHRYRLRRDPQAELRLRLRDLAAARVRYGYRHLHVLLRTKGWPVTLPAATAPKCNVVVAYQAPPCKKIKTGV